MRMPRMVCGAEASAGAEVGGFWVVMVSIPFDQSVL